MPALVSAMLELQQSLATLIVQLDVGPVAHDARAVRRFVIHAGQRALFVNAHDIDWIEADGNYVRLHIQRESFRLRQTLATLVTRLDPQEFVRIHKSTIVNVDRIQEVQPWYGGDHVAILRDGRQLRVSRTYARVLLRQMW